MFCRRREENRRCRSGRRWRKGLQKQQEGIADDVDDAVAVGDPGVGGHRQVGQQEAGEVALAAGLVEVVAAIRVAAGAVGQVAHAGIDVEFGAVGWALSQRRWGASGKLAAQLWRWRQVLAGRRPGPRPGRSWAAGGSGRPELGLR